MYQPPIITGESTVEEGDTLSLICDSSNSNQEPTVKWFNEENEVVSIFGPLTISKITRPEAGNFTCVTFPPNPDNSTSNSVTVIVQCK